jgi:hypothetical protein
VGHLTVVAMKSSWLRLRQGGVQMRESRGRGALDQAEDQAGDQVEEGP